MVPHHHLVMGTIEGAVNCYGRSFDIRRYRRRFDACDCLSHSLARPWYELTGDSDIVHAIPVVGAEGAGGYMAKYLEKTFGMEDRLKAVGMSRRWSSNRGWPGAGRLRLKQTEDGGWAQRKYEKGRIPVESLVTGGDISERAGEMLTKVYLDKKAGMAAPKRLIRLVKS